MEKKCTNEADGILLETYGLDILSQSETKRFEKHLLTCDFCREKFAQLIPITTALHQERARRMELRLANNAGERQVPIGEVIGRFVDLIKRPKVLAPAVAALAVFILMVAVLQANPYKKLLTSEPLPGEIGIVYRDTPGSAQQQFDQGMHDYLAKDYHSAARAFRLALEQAPDEGPWWLYLGVCYYLEREPQKAIEALGKVNEPAESPFKAKAQWYLAHSLLMKRKADQAIKLLNWQIEQDTRYADEAKALKSKVEAIRK